MSKKSKQLLNSKSLVKGLIFYFYTFEVKSISNSFKSVSHLVSDNKLIGIYFCWSVLKYSFFISVDDSCNSVFERNTIHSLHTHFNTSQRWIDLPYDIHSHNDFKVNPIHLSDCLQTESCFSWGWLEYKWPIFRVSWDRTHPRTPFNSSCILMYNSRWEVAMIWSEQVIKWNLLKVSCLEWLAIYLDGDKIEDICFSE